MKDPMIEEGKVLLVISDCDEYYFHSLYYKSVGAETNLSYTVFPHTGMTRDSFLIESEDATIDIRYIVESEKLIFYSEDTDDKPFYIENIGDDTLYARTSKGLFQLNPGERKKISHEYAR